MKIPFVNLTDQHSSIKARLLESVATVIDHGNFILGEEVDQFERRFAETCGVEYAIGVNSGTDALVLALKALDIGQGDEVITTPGSFVASASCIALTGAKPVFVDVSDDYNIDPKLIEAAITAKTRAILPVHLTGRPANMSAIMKIAAGNGLEVIEDCAQAVSAEHAGIKVGSFGAIGCFSLHPLKTLSACGDGGVLVTKDEVLHRRLRTLRNLGLRSRDDCVEWGHNSRLDTIQAAMLLVKLDYLETWTERRRSNAKTYQKLLKGLYQVRTPTDQENDRSVYHTFVIQAERRDELKDFLASTGIGTAIHYPTPIHLQKAAGDLGLGPGSFPVAEQQALHILSLPIYPELEPRQLEYIASQIWNFYETTDKDGSPLLLSKQTVR